MGRISSNSPIQTTFGHLFDPKREVDVKTGDVKEKYQVTLLFNENDAGNQEDLRRFKEEAFKVGVEAFGPNFEAMVNQGSIRWPFRDGGEINPKTGEVRFGQGITFTNCSSASKPDVVSRYYDPQDPNKRPRVVTNPAEYWWGQYARVNVTFKEYKRKDGNGVACYINGLQLWHEGDKLGNSFDARSEFDAEGEAPPAEFGGQAEAPPTGGGGSSLL